MEGFWQILKAGCHLMNATCLLGCLWMTQTLGKKKYYSPLTSRPPLLTKDVNKDKPRSKNEHRCLFLAIPNNVGKTLNTHFLIKLYRILTINTHPRSFVQRWFRLSFCTPFGLAQFCEKPCYPVFHVLQFFKRSEVHILSIFFAFYVYGEHLASRRRVWEAWTSPAGNIALTTGIPSGDRTTTQFSTGHTVRPETSTEQSSFRGIYVVQDLNAGREENCSPVSIKYNFKEPLWGSSWICRFKSRRSLKEFLPKPKELVKFQKTYRSVK